MILRWRLLGAAFVVALALVPVGAFAQGDSVALPTLATAPNVAGVVDASWAGASKVVIGHDFTFKRGANEPATAYLAQSGSALYLAFVVPQKEAIVAATRTNGGGVINDDSVGIFIAPDGSNGGFLYNFLANPLGARYQTSTENSAYSPQWTAVATTSATGYTVTMRIPFNVMRAAKKHDWAIQLLRFTVSRSSLDEWSFNPAEQTPQDPEYFGTLTGSIAVGTAVAKLPPPRLQMYGLDERASAAAGGSTARIGADLAVPFTPTASVLAAIHPDYSNVEIDQQTISPTEFPRTYTEVRPFFTQVGGGFNNHVGCLNCPTLLYTPAIPNFRDGLAVEGTQGPVAFAAYDANGYQRDDAAQVLTYADKQPGSLFSVSEQRVDVDTPQFDDNVTSTEGGYVDRKGGLFAYGNFATDRGTFVTDPSQAEYGELGVGVVNATTQGGISLQENGAQFNPVDGYVAHADTAGFTSFLSKTFNLSSTAFLRQVAFNEFIDGLHDHTGALDQVDYSTNLTVSTRTLFSLSGQVGSSFLRLPNGQLVPFDQDGLALGYDQSTATPATASYYTGQYYYGRLNSSLNNATFALTKRLLFTGEADDTLYTPGAAGGILANQWLERTGLVWQFNQDSSLAVGGRRIIGITAPTSYAVPSTQVIDATNLTAAFHFLALRNEFYVVYGDPNSLSTTPALFLKWIRYIGAPKGT